MNNKGQKINNLQTNNGQKMNLNSNYANNFPQKNNKQPFANKQNMKMNNGRMHHKQGQQQQPQQFQQKQYQQQQPEPLFDFNNQGQQQKRDWPMDISLDDRYYRQVFTYDTITTANALLVLGLNVHILYYLITVVNNLCECAYGSARNFFMTMVVIMILINLMLIFKVKLNTFIVIMYLIVLLCYVISGFIFVYQVEDEETGCICARTEMLNLTKYILRLMIIVLLLSLALVLYNYAVM